MTSPGVHAFLIILRVDRFTPEEKDTVDFITKIFGVDAAKYCIVIFTREDQLDEGQTIDEFVNSSAELKKLVEICGNRKFGINNRLSDEQLKSKTKQLLKLIHDTVKSNNDRCYTNDMYQQIKQEREAQEKRKKEERDREKQEYEDQIYYSGWSQGRAKGRAEAKTAAKEKKQAEVQKEAEAKKSYEDGEGGGCGGSSCSGYTSNWETSWDGESFWMGDN
ncbi:unnamed protein product [Rotaria sp. Silwood1]|nr:unnamed protein product [Rotaria sp. Silwood1]